MRQQWISGTGRVARTARELWPDHNPLRRGSDRAEAGIVALLIGAFLLGTPLIALDRRRLAAWETDWRTSSLSGPAGASPER